MAKITRIEKANRKVTDTILKIMSEGTVPWKKGWTATVQGGLQPFNLDSGRAFKGMGNRLICALTCPTDIPAYAPFSKLHPAKKGAKSIPIVSAVMFEKENPKTKKIEMKFCGFKVIPEFHYTDLQGIDVEALEAKYAPKSDGNAPSFNPIEKCDTVVAGMPNAPRINSNGGDRAYYTPRADEISMPNKIDFHSSEEYYRTLFHELGHSTGHFSRLNRKEGMENIRHGSHNYSFEELVAELTACFLGSECGIMNEEGLNNSASYISQWIKTLQSNTDWFITASAKAHKASEYILNRTKEKEEVIAA